MHNSHMLVPLPEGPTRRPQDMGERTPNMCRAGRMGFCMRTAAQHRRNAITCSPGASEGLSFFVRSAYEHIEKGSMVRRALLQGKRAISNLSVCMHVVSKQRQRRCTAVRVQT